MGGKVYTSAENLLDLMQAFLLAMIVVGPLFAAIMSDQDPHTGLWARAAIFGVGLLGRVVLTAISLAAIVAIIIARFWAWGLAFPSVHAR